MVIQRFQTLFLIAAAVLLAVFIFVPFGFSVIDTPDAAEIVEDWTPLQFLGLWLPTAIGALIYLVAVFCYGNMDFQKTLVWVGFALNLAAIGITVYILAGGFDDFTAGDVITRTKWGGGGLLLVAGALSALLAISRIKADQRLLRNMDRLR